MGTKYLAYQASLIVLLGMYTERGGFPVTTACYDILGCHFQARHECLQDKDLLKSCSKVNWTSSSECLFSSQGGSNETRHWHACSMSDSRVSDRSI